MTPTADRDGGVTLSASQTSFFAGSSSLETGVPAGQVHAYATDGRDMRARGAILLISCYELGHQPLGIASPIGFLERARYAPDAMDISVEEFDTEKVKRVRFIGISVPMHTSLRLGVRVADRIREIHRTSHICFYGIYALLNARYLLEHVADSVIGGEFEGPLLNLVEALASGHLGDLKGVSHQAKQVGPFLKHLSFPLPSRSALPPLGKYAQFERNGLQSLVGYVEASRGCLHYCLHCPIPPVYSGRFFAVPKEIVLEDIRGLVRRGARHITFGDPDFLNGPTHSLRILRAMHETFPHLTFDFTAKIEHVLKHRSFFPEIANLGCEFMVSAVESLSDTVLANLEKGHTRADAFEALAILRDAGIAFRPAWVAFTPWTTLDDYIDMVEFIAENRLVYHVDPVQYTIRLLVPPGSALLSLPAIQKFLGPLDQASFIYPWTHSDPLMDFLYQAVRAVVEEAARADEDPALTFNRVRALAYAARGDEMPQGDSHVPVQRQNRPPRLTEAWYCCAEPTEDQFQSVGPSVDDTPRVRQLGAV